MSLGDRLREWLLELATFSVLNGLEFINCRRGDLFLEFDGETLTASVDGTSWTLRASDLDGERFEVVARS